MRKFDFKAFAVSVAVIGANSNRVFRMDPARRFQGRTFAGIGAPRSSNLVNAGVSRAPERVFNAGALRPSGQPRGAVGARPLPGIRSANPFTSSRVYSEPRAQEGHLRRVPLRRMAAEHLLLQQGDREGAKE